MKRELSLSEQLMYSTVRIESTHRNGMRSTGTGFFMRLLSTSETEFVPVIVTNKHVVEDANYGSLIFTQTDEHGNPKHGDLVTIEVEDFDSQWIGHPEDNVDLCIMPLAPILRLARENGKKPYLITLDTAIIPSDEQLFELNSIEDIIMIGYPNGIWDKVNNLPIIRRGITATHPAIDYNGKQEFMIDAACYPGSSGSPVILFNYGSFSDKKGILYAGTRSLLLGVLYAGPQYTTEGEIKIVDIPTRQQAISISRVPNNLGIIIKAKKILDFEHILRDISGKGTVV